MTAEHSRDCELGGEGIKAKELEKVSCRVIFELGHLKLARNWARQG